MAMNPGLTMAAVLALALAAAPAVAQVFDPALGAEAVGVSGEGRVVVQNGDAVFDCALSAMDGAVSLDDCQPRMAAIADAAGVLGALSDADWQALVRDTIIDQECRISAFGGVADVIETAALANGIDPETVARVRAEVAARAEAAVSEMLRDGRLTYRGGELALDDCA